MAAGGGGGGCVRVCGLGFRGINGEMCVAWRGGAGPFVPTSPCINSIRVVSCGRPGALLDYDRHTVGVDDERFATAVSRLRRAIKDLLSHVRRAIRALFGTPARRGSGIADRREGRGGEG